MAWSASSVDDGIGEIKFSMFSAEFGIFFSGEMNLTFNVIWFLFSGNGWALGRNHGNKYWAYCLYIGKFNKYDIIRDYNGNTLTAGISFCLFWPCVNSFVTIFGVYKIVVIFDDPNFDIFHPETRAQIWFFLQDTRAQIEIWWKKDVVR